MRMTVRVTPRARRRGIERAEDGTWIVRVTEPAEDGRANEALVDALAAHFGVPKRSITIVRGHTARLKLIDVPGAG